MSVDLAKLKYHIGHSKFSFHQLCVKAGLNRSAYRYWNGEREFPLEVALKIAHYISIPANEFLDTNTVWLINNTVRRHNDT